MTNKHLVLGLVVASTLVILTSVKMRVRASEPSCYMQTNNGKLIDLTRLCGREASPKSAVPQASGADNPNAATGNPQMTSTPSNSTNVGKIDPNAPADNPLILRKTPSQLWNSLPDLPSPPVKGSTSP